VRGASLLVKRRACLAGACATGSSAIGRPSRLSSSWS